MSFGSVRNLTLIACPRIPSFKHRRLNHLLYSYLSPTLYVHTLRDDNNNQVQIINYDAIDCSIFNFHPRLNYRYN
jgi:hypothetical protein